MKSLIRKKKHQFGPTLPNCITNGLLNPLCCFPLSLHDLTLHCFYQRALFFQQQNSSSVCFFPICASLSWLFVLPPRGWEDWRWVGETYAGSIVLGTWGKKQKTKNKTTSDWEKWNETVFQIGTPSRKLGQGSPIFLLFKIAGWILMEWINVAF